MAITSLPTPPSRSDPENFAERADGFMAALPRFANEANALQLDVTQSAANADNDAMAAAQSAYAAESSRAAAGSSADAAALSQQGAGQKAAESRDSATLARQWATKLNEPVEAGEFSARHYAQLAAQGMGLPILPPNAIPTTNVGPIFVSGQGPMEWNGSRYVVLWGDHGQCRFVYVSPTECRLMPCNGDGLIINGKQHRIPAGGVSLSPAALAGGNSTWNYVYAYDNAGGFAIEGALTAHELGAGGIRTKIGDPSRTLIGVAYKNSVGQFQFDNQNRGVSSWFNRDYPVSGGNSSAGSATASGTPVQIFGVGGVWVWAGEHLRACIWGSARNDVAGGVAAAYARIDTSTEIGSVFVNSAAADASVGIPVNVTTQHVNVAFSEGFHYLDIYGSTGGTGTARYVASASLQAYKG